MAPATGYVPRAPPWDHQGSANLVKREPPQQGTFTGYIAAIVILAAIIFGKSPFAYRVGQ